MANLLSDQRSNPRFQGDNFEKNKTIYSKMEMLAEKHRCTAAQLALAWVLHQGDDVVPIPGESCSSSSTSTQRTCPTPVIVLRITSFMFHLIVVILFLSCLFKKLNSDFPLNKLLVFSATHEYAESK